MEKYTYDDLCRIMERLRGENGCPWDRKQTHASLRDAIIEEVYEFADAIDQSDTPGMCEELGDILMLTVFHGQLAEAAGYFSNSDVADGVCRKMISRHSHVFGADTAATPEEALITWDKNKSVEKSYTSVTDTLRSVPRALPSLMRAQKVCKRAGLNTDVEDIRINLKSAVDKLLENSTTDQLEITDQIGEILLQMVDFSRIFKINAEFALTNAVEKFINRFETDEIDRNRLEL